MLGTFGLGLGACDPSLRLRVLQQQAEVFDRGLGQYLVLDLKLLFLGNYRGLKNYRHRFRCSLSSLWYNMPPNSVLVVKASTLNPP